MLQTLTSSGVVFCDIAWRDINVIDIKFYLVEYDLQDMDVGLKFTEIQKKTQWTKRIVIKYVTI